MRIRRCRWLVLISLGLLACGSVRAQLPAVSVIPQESRIHVDSIVTIAIFLDNVVGLHAYSIRLSYDTTIIGCRSVRKRNFFGLTSFFFSRIDSNAGAVQADEAILGPYSRSGSGYLVELDFIGRRNGTSYVSFVSVDFRDSTNHQIPNLPVGGRVVVGPSLGVRQRPTSLPGTFSLGAYPNPFNPKTTLLYSLPRQSQVNLKLFDTQGKLIENLVSESQTAGMHRVDLNVSGRASGVYFVRLEAAQQFLTKQIILLK